MTCHRVKLALRQAARGRALSAPFDQVVPRGWKWPLFPPQTSQGRQCEDRASWSLFSSPRGQLSSKQTTEAQRGLAPRNLVSSEAFQRTPLNINSRTEKGMQQDFTFSGGGKEQCAAQAISGTVGPPHPKNLLLRASLINWKSCRENRICWAPTPAQAKGASELPFLSPTRAMLTEQREQQACLWVLKAKRSGEQRTQQAVLRRGGDLLSQGATSRS